MAYRLQAEYGVECGFESVEVATARWVHTADESLLEEFQRKAYGYLAVDHADCLVYIAPTRVNLGLTVERWPDIDFRATREQLAA